MTQEGHNNINRDFYELTSSEFEILVAQLLAQAGYTNVRLVGGPGDQGVDILATKEKEQIAIQVKHKTHLTVYEIERFVNRYFSNPSTPNNLVFITSADLPQDVALISARVPPGKGLTFIGRQELQQMLLNNIDVIGGILKSAEKRASTQKRYLGFGYIGTFFSILGLLISVYQMVYPPPKATLDKRIESVSKALSSIRDLETNLAEIKAEMIDKQKATEKIHEKYAQAKELEKLTTTQLAALQATLSVQNWSWTLINYALGFVLGIASSFVASVLYSRWKQRKALT